MYRERSQYFGEDSSANSGTHILQKGKNIVRNWHNNVVFTTHEKTYAQKTMLKTNMATPRRRKRKVRQRWHL